MRATIERGGGVHEDFRALFDGHATRVVRLAVLLGAEDPEDVAQEAFCRLFEKRDLLRGSIAEAGAYLNRTVVNLVRDRHRRSMTHRRLGLLSRRDDERLAPSAEELGVRADDRRRVTVALNPSRHVAVKPWSCGTGSTCRTQTSPSSWARASARPSPRSPGDSTTCTPTWRSHEQQGTSGARAARRRGT